MNPMMMMAIPAILSAIGGLTGSKAKQGSTYTKGQRGTIDDILQSIKGMKGNQDITQNQGFQGGQDWLNSLFNDQDFFNRFEAPAQRNFQENTVPDLANRFAAMGSGGSLGSTGFRNQLAREGSNLQTNLAAMRGGMQQQGVGQQLQYAQQPFQNLMQLLQQGLQPTQNQYHPASTGFGGNIGSSMFGGLASGYGQQAGQMMAQQNNGNDSTNMLNGAGGAMLGQRQY
jgi:hypothetical protein